MGGTTMTSVSATESLDGAPDTEVCHLRLYVAGHSPKSLKALGNLKRICEEHLHDRYQLEVVDLVANPRLAADDEIIAVPTLVRLQPGTTPRIIGDLSDAQSVLVGLQLQPKDR